MNSHSRKCVVHNQPLRQPAERVFAQLIIVRRRTKVFCCSGDECECLQVHTQTPTHVAFRESRSVFCVYQSCICVYVYVCRWYFGFATDEQAERIDKIAIWANGTQA